MAMKSGLERLYATLNGEDYDEPTPSIDVEINVIQKEAEAEEEANEINEAATEVTEAADTAEQTEVEVEEAEMIAKILRNDGLNPLALKIISTNKLITDVWRITLPSMESLDSVGMNRRQAEMIAAAIEAKVEGAWNKVKDLWTRAIRMIKALIIKWFGRANKNMQKVEKLVNELSSWPKGSFDEDKAATITKKVISPENALKLRTELDSCVKKIIGFKGPFNDSSLGTIESKIKEVEDSIDACNKTFDDTKYEEKNLKAVYSEMKGMAYMGDIKNSNLYKSISDIKGIKDSLDKSATEMELVIDDASNNDASSELKSILNKIKGVKTRATTLVMKLYNNLQTNFITIASGFVSCKRENKDSDKK